MQTVIAAIFLSICSIAISYAGASDHQPDGDTNGVDTFAANVENATPDEADLISNGLMHVMTNGFTAVESKGGDIQKLQKAFQRNNDLKACGMVWHRDEPRPKGLYSVWRPTRPVAIIVNLVRNGVLVGSTHFVIRPPNQEISLLINQNGRDHDGVHSCVVTL